ncbi:putative transmembrane protein [Senna tora]|uniref:Putative transmembrane protein n=1 Tax=Senna tora TaxID=362788 RepID=A0A834T7U0_9FABA|nr:putative transmembrane protein [Senna tora]
MALKIKNFLIVLLLVVFISSSSDLVEGFRESMHPSHHLLHKDGRKMNWRKLLSHEYMLDYDEGGANPRHAKKPGKGT